MVIKITPTQAKRIRELIREWCCNCVNDNCLLLDNGDSHKCIQLISRTGIYCNYFLTSVLPNDVELYIEIQYKDNVIQCRRCGKKFGSVYKQRKYCADCSQIMKRKKAAERQAKQRLKEKEKKYNERK